MVDKTDVKAYAKYQLEEAVTICYSDKILDIIIDDVVSDVEETAAPENWTEDDVRLAIGRVLCKRLGLEV